MSLNDSNEARDRRCSILAWPKRTKEAKEGSGRQPFGQLVAFVRKQILAFASRLRYSDLMKVQFTYWQERDGQFLGYLNDYPDHWTQGDSLEDLKEHLKDLVQMFTADQIPGIKKVGELEVA